LAPSEPNVCSGGQKAMPEVASVQVKWTVGGVWYQPAPLGVVLMLPVMTGAVASRLMIAVVEERLPALSTAGPVTVWPAPSPVTVTGSGHEATPDSASEQVNVTVTALFCQPAALASGATV